MQALSQTKRGESYTIKWMFGIPEVLEFMKRYQIQEGSQVQVIQNHKDCVIIGARDKRLAIGKEIADRIKAEVFVIPVCAMRSLILSISCSEIKM